MTRKYSLVIEGDPTGYSAYVPELPTILVTARSLSDPCDASQPLQSRRVILYMIVVY